MRRSVCSMNSSPDSKEKLFVFKRSSHTPLSETDSSADGKKRNVEQTINLIILIFFFANCVK